MTDNDLHIKLEKIALQSSISAAIAAHKWVGKGDANSADAAAVDAMRKVLIGNNYFTGRVVIGEGERDEAPMLYIGETLGSGNSKCDIAVDPLEGTSLCANGMINSMTTIAIGDNNSLLHAPDVYMEKIACRENVDGIDINLSIEENLDIVGFDLEKTASEISVLVLDRPRHRELIQKIRDYGAKVKLISDGDISGVIRATMNADIDLYIGSGGAPEGVLAACALKVIGGTFQGKLVCDSPAKQERARKMGIVDFNKVYNIEDMVPGNVVFCMTGVTRGDLLDEIVYSDEHILTHSLLFNSYNNTKQDIWFTQKA